MHKKAGVKTLLVVALVALGLMAFMSFNSGLTGNVQGVGAGSPMGIGGGQAYTNPIREESTYYTIAGAQSTQQMQKTEQMVEDLLHLQLLVHCKGATEMEIKSLCRKYSVPTS